jgi:hypothetical protein
MASTKVGVMNSTDLLLIALPKHGVNVPPLSLPYLAGAVKASGFSVICKDLNFDLWRKTLETPWARLWEETDVTIFKGESFDRFVAEFYGDVVRGWAREIVALRPKWLGISLFSYRSIPTLRLLVPWCASSRPKSKSSLGERQSIPTVLSLLSRD